MKSTYKSVTFIVPALKIHIRSWLELMSPNELDDIIFFEMLETCLSGKIAQTASAVCFNFYR